MHISKMLYNKITVKKIGLQEMNSVYNIKLVNETLSIIQYKHYDKNLFVFGY